MAVKLYGPEEITLGVTEVGPGHKRERISRSQGSSPRWDQKRRFSRFPPGVVTLTPYVKLTASGSLQSMLTVCKYVYIIKMNRNQKFRYTM